jgi:hypothetical protein
VDHPSQTIKNEVTRSPKIELMRSVSRVAERQARGSTEDSASSEKTRIALLRLDDCPTDESAIDALWEENHVAIELEMKCHLHSSTNPALLNRLLSGMISLSRYYCEEMTSPLGRQMRQS